MPDHRNDETSEIGRAGNPARTRRADQKVIQVSLLPSVVRGRGTLRHVGSSENSATAHLAPTPKCAIVEMTNASPNSLCQSRGSDRLFCCDHPQCDEVGFPQCGLPPRSGQSFARHSWQRPREHGDRAQARKGGGDVTRPACVDRRTANSWPQPGTDYIRRLAQQSHRPAAGRLE